MTTNMPEEVKKEYPVKNEDMVSIWAELNTGITLEEMTIEEALNQLQHD